MPADPVLYAVEEAVATITLNRPARRKALSGAAANRLHDIWREVDPGQIGLHHRPDHKGAWGQDGQLTAVGEAFG